jgi:hypothetical protein
MRLAFLVFNVLRHPDTLNDERPALPSYTATRR